MAQSGAKRRGGCKESTEEKADSARSDQSKKIADSKSGENKQIAGGKGIKHY